MASTLVCKLLIDVSFTSTRVFTDTIPAAFVSVAVLIVLTELSVLPIFVNMVVEKLASSPNASANSFNVSSASGALLTNSETLVSTYVTVE